MYCALNKTLFTSHPKVYCKTWHICVGQVSQTRQFFSVSKEINILNEAIMSFLHQLVSYFGNELTFEDTNINELFYSHSPFHHVLQLIL